MNATLRRTAVVVVGAGLAAVLTAGPALAGTRVTGTDPGGTRVTNRDWAVPGDSPWTAGTRVTDQDLAVPVDNPWVNTPAGTRVTGAGAAVAGALAGAVADDREY
jgi:hypothetical protein